MNNNPQIYIACLASYNNGILFGTWIDATQSLDIVYQEIQTMLANSPISGAEEWAIHDYEGFCNYQIDEYEDIQTICEIAEFIVEQGILGIEVMQILNCNVEQAKEVIANQYYRAYENELEFAMQLFDDCYGSEIPTALEHYIDYEAFQRDLFINDYFSLELDGETRVFSNC